MTEDNYRVVPEVPEVSTYLSLRAAGALSAFSEAAAAIGLKGTYFAVTLKLGDEPIGMGRIVGDGGCFFQIVDIVVKPAHRGRGLGKKIMAALMRHLRDRAPQSAYISLIADVPANKLYEQFGFRETAPRSLGMAVQMT